MSIVDTSWRVALLYLLAAIIGLAGAWSSIGPDTMSGDPIEMRSGTGAAAAGLAGFRYYVADDWHLPLLHTTKLDAPEGTVIAFTDSIPILALVAKSVRGLGIAAERWWGWWAAAAFVTESLAAVFALRSWRVTSFGTSLSAAVVLVMFPPFLFRVVHPALGFHAPLIVAIGLAGLLRFSRSKAVLPAAVALPIVGLLIHPYHLLACLVVLAGAYVDAVRLDTRSGRALLTWASSCVASLGLVGWIGGYFSQEAVLAAGYDDFALTGRSATQPSSDPSSSSLGSTAGTPSWPWLRRRPCSKLSTSTSCGSSTATSTCRTRLATTNLRRSVGCPTELAATPTDRTLVVSARPGLLDTTGLDCRQWSAEVTVCSTRWDGLSPGARAQFS